MRTLCLSLWAMPNCFLRQQITKRSCQWSTRRCHHHLLCCFHFNHSSAKECDLIVTLVPPQGLSFLVLCISRYGYGYRCRCRCRYSRKKCIWLFCTDLESSLFIIHYSFLRLFQALVNLHLRKHQFWQFASVLLLLRKSGLKEFLTPPLWKSYDPLNFFGIGQRQTSVSQQVSSSSGYCHERWGAPIRLHQLRLSFTKMGGNHKPHPLSFAHF